MRSSKKKAVKVGSIILFIALAGLATGVLVEYFYDKFFSNKQIELVVDNHVAVCEDGTTHPSKYVKRIILDLKDSVFVMEGEGGDKTFKYVEDVSDPDLPSYLCIDQYGYYYMFCLSGEDILLFKKNEKCFMIFKKNADDARPGALPANGGGDNYRKATLIST